MRILNFVFAALTCLVAVNCWAQEPNAPQLVKFILTTGEYRGHILYLIDGELLVRPGSDKLLDPDPDVKAYESVATGFTILNTSKGDLIILRPKAAGQGKQAAKNLDLESYYITADYSSTPPSIKFTKEPEKYSYWKVPKHSEGQIVNISDFKRPAYLSVDSQNVVYNVPGSNGSVHLRRATLSLDPTYQFKVEKIENNDLPFLDETR